MKSFYALLISILIYASCIASPHQVEQKFIPHIDNSNNKIEYYLLKPKDKDPKAVLIFLHGHQKQGERIGGLKYVKQNILSRYADMGYSSIVISFPGYGNSDGERDWCGPYSQRAVISLIEYLNKHENIGKDKIYLIGNSRGGVVAGMVATQEPDLAGVVLSSSFYDPATVAEETTVVNMRKEGVIDANSFDKRSVMDKADKINSPILMLHGYYDKKALIAPTFEFYNKMMSLKKDVTLLVFPTPHRLPQDEKYKAIDMFIQRKD